MKPRLAVALLALLLLALPARAVKKDTQLILDEIQRLSESLDKLAAQVAELLKHAAIADEKISAVARSQADLAQSRENTMLSLQYLKEELSGLKDSVGRLNDRLQSIPAAGPPAAAGGGGEPQGNEAAAVQDPSSVYYAAYSDYIKENFDLAIEGFRQFIQSFPDSGLADNSLYWIGECHYAKKKYQEAITTFNELLSRYKDGDKVPAAILKKGYALIEMGRQGEGIVILKELISRFPLSEEASLAGQKIKEFSE
ncbi:MAG: tol-pal system protein YbgF [Acidobacteria bacterium]|jgi:tol-pal system protein YbgF|nr:tol-pal system protein YbgF [Acidobacteriota bacterium]